MHTKLVMDRIVENQCQKVERDPELVNNLETPARIN